MISRKPVGFTLVELIVVIILLAIVSVYATSRYIGVGSFSAFAIQENVISVIRQVQVNRMQSNVEVTAGLNDLTLQISSDCIGSQRACAQRLDSDSNWVSDKNVSFSPNNTVVQFDLLGNPTPKIMVPIEIKIFSNTSDDEAQVYICPNGLISSSGCI